MHFIENCQIDGSFSDFIDDLIDYVLTKGTKKSKKLKRNYPKNIPIIKREVFSSR